MSIHLKPARNIWLVKTLVCAMTKSFHIVCFRMQISKTLLVTCGSGKTKGNDSYTSNQRNQIRTGFAPYTVNLRA